MIWTSFFLMLGALLGGLAVYLVGYQQKPIRLPLIFAGSFLFSITIIHILPELFKISDKPFEIGLYLLIGFFFQSFLEYFTQGVEHGHYHVGSHGRSNISLIIALVLHSLLEGALLTHESPFHGRHESYSLLFGIILHKAPAAYALMAICKSDHHFHWRQILILMIFAISSPVGMYVSSILDFTSGAFLLFYAFVSGNFLHISTTIFVETSPDHSPKLNRIVVSLLGAAVAVASEMFI